MIALPTNDPALRRQVEATYWTYKILSEFPDDAGSEMKELVLRLAGQESGSWRE